jgi:hypothetical protein
VPEGNTTSTPGGVGALFSTEAADNAEVVPPTDLRGPDSMWSTGESGAPPLDDADADADTVVGELVDEDAREPSNGHGAGGYGRPPGAATSAPNDDPSRSEGVFSAEPVSRPEDLLDEADEFLDADLHRSSFSDIDQGAPLSPPSTANGAPLFSSGGTEEEPTDPWVTVSDDGGAEEVEGLFEAPAYGREADREPVTAPPPYATSRDKSAAINGSFHRIDDDAPDPTGFRAAICRLGPSAAERAAVPISVCGALLHERERVLGALTGQMLGQPAVIVVTDSRVLVVNDRRWQPIVDEFPIDSSLVVRGRHDRNVAALSFADSTRLAMVDGITEVALAIELAERIREVGSR